MLALHMTLICGITLKLWSGAYQTRSITSSFSWFTRNNRHDSPNAGRGQRALSMTSVPTSGEFPLDWEV